MHIKIDRTFLRSRVARRIFALFILCALLPISALALLSFRQVTKQLNQESQSRLRQATKNVGVAIYERLGFLEADMRLIGFNAGLGSAVIPQMGSEESRPDFTRRFTGLVLVTDPGGERSLYGRVPNPPELTDPEKQHVLSGRTLVTTRSSPDRPARIFMSRALDPRDPRRRILLGEINPAYLWDTGDDSTLPARTELCVLDQANTGLFCSPELPAFIPEEASASVRHSIAGQFEWEHQGRQYLASYRTMPLQSRFLTPSWTVVLSESKADVLAPMDQFKKTFPLVILLSLWVVLLLSVSQIRRSLVPLEKLQGGTRRIAARDFDTRVEVSSGDEFEELAASFNSMAARLGRQFHTLTTMAEIDRAILSALDTRTIVSTVLTRMRDVSPCDGVGVTLSDSRAPDTVRTYVANGQPEDPPWAEAIVLTPDQVGRLRENPENLLILDQDIPPYLAPLAARGHKAFLLLPLFIQERLAGIITLGSNNPPVYSEDDLVRARQVADQVAVALANARLLEELDQMNWGTLTALARAIDAKSPWTAGHSERVTDLALKIGRVLGFSQKELEVMHRGGLLHDIGKIGTPPAVLDKAGRLTEEETRLMREHVRMGARILEPIPAYAEVMPIVWQHHERFDGTGYPNGLAGEEISLAARTFAVADCFDALISDRPYRQGLAREQVIDFIKQGAGRQFDPKVVNAFLEVMAQESAKSSGQPTPVPSMLASLGFSQGEALGQPDAMTGPLSLAGRDT